MRRSLEYVSALLFGALFVVLVAVADHGRVLAILGRTDLGLYGVAVLGFLATYPVAAFRWQVIQRATDVDLSLRQSFEILAVSYGLNKLLPANSGDVARSSYSKRYVDLPGHGTVMGSVVVERAADILTISVLILVGTPFVPGLQGKLIAVALGAAAAAALGALAVVRLGGRDLPGWMPDVLSDEIERGSRAVDAMSRERSIAVGALSLLRWLMLGTVFAVLAAAIGVGIGFGLAVVVTASMSLAAVLPFSPGGVGPVETMGVGLLVLSGVAFDGALALVVLQRTLGLGFVAAIGLVVYSLRVLPASSAPE